MTALCTVQGKEKYKAHMRAKHKKPRTQLEVQRAPTRPRFCTDGSSGTGNYRQPCAYCGRAAVPGEDPPGSIDRVDNLATAYTMNPAVPCCLE
jgi:hypothetical protein